MSKQGKAIAIAQAILKASESAFKFNRETGLYILGREWIEAQVSPIIHKPHSYFMRDGSINKRKVDSDRRKLTKNTVNDLHLVDGDGKKHVVSVNLRGVR